MNTNLLSVIKIPSYLMSGESVEFRHTVSQGTISIDNPHIAVRPTQLGSESKTSSDTKGTKGTRIQPAQGASWSENIHRNMRKCFWPFDYRYLH